MQIAGYPVSLLPVIFSFKNKPCVSNNVIMVIMNFSYTTLEVSLRDQFYVYIKFAYLHCQFGLICAWNND